MNWPTFELNEEHLTFHLRCKHSGTFANRKYEDLSYPKKTENFRPILVTLLKMQPQYSQSSRENATPSSGTSSSAFYKEVHSPGAEAWLTISVTLFKYPLSLLRKR